MSLKLIAETVTLEVDDCPSCHVLYAVPVSLLDRKRRDGGAWYCPNGHSVVYSKSDADRLRDENNALRTQAAKVNKLNQQLANDLLDTRKELKRVERRIHAGVCPHCNRTFQNVSRHMQSKHAGSA